MQRLIESLVLSAALITVADWEEMYAEGGGLPIERVDCTSLENAREILSQHEEMAS